MVLAFVLSYCWGKFRHRGDVERTTSFEARECLSSQSSIPLYPSPSYRRVDMYTARISSLHFPGASWYRVGAGHAYSSSSPPWTYLCRMSFHWRCSCVSNHPPQLTKHSQRENIRPCCGYPRSGPSRCWSPCVTLSHMFLQFSHHSQLGRQHTARRRRHWRRRRRA